MLLNEAYEYMFIDWLNETRTVGIDLSEEKLEQKIARDTIKIGRVNCKKYMNSVCGRILKNDQKLPRFIILSNQTSYEYRGNLTYNYLKNQVISKEFELLADEGER